LRRAPARPRSIETRLGGSADAHVDPKTRTAISGFGQSNALSEDGSGSSRTAGRPAIEAGRRSNGDSFCPKRLNNVSQRKRDQKEEIHVDQDGLDFGSRPIRRSDRFGIRRRDRIVLGVNIRFRYCTKRAPESGRRR
jgi:hypothetical protein